MIRIFRRKRSRGQSNEFLVEAGASLEHARAARQAEEDKQAAETGVIESLNHLRQRMREHNHVTETITYIIQGRDKEK